MNRISNLVKRLIHPWINTGRTITTDNYFTNVELVEDLLSAQTTLVGTMRRNKKEIPPELESNSQRPEESSIFCFGRQLALVRYVPKKGKAVILLSTMHHDKFVNDERKKQPDIILYYNNTKGGVDLMDQTVKTYSCRRKIKRWPMAFFFNIIDVGTVAAFIIWISKKPKWNEEKLCRRRLFLLQLGFELVEARLHRRQQQSQSIQQSVGWVMQTIGLPVIIPMPDSMSESYVRRRCQLCPRQRDHRAITHCNSCNVPCCSDHHKVICDMCCETFLK
ncbi:unnamed protein product [Rotaria magnacalcarata]|uniref:PiggyBac transposable element-derived protein domain-containing protein n=1 Tax=Rotaria magnacalcarata TaxID=392030 RepID=A0A816VU51_9BILA|nr:unnamed protein product [Rotaria magnacalcarata]CAF2125213.1 unnamed protein product [Rotaria magnacalcarata]CAF4131182.1 unnamed protein product [Rotaria magnacalcarata]CAF4162193.1 unnamed protein product [Rotaria magnacalcarata]